VSGTTCEVCGRDWSELPGDGDGWLSLELSRNEPRGAGGYWEVEFCSKEHAAQWLAQPLPEEPAEPVDRSWKGRLAGFGAFLIAAFLIVSFFVGVVVTLSAVVRLVT
jgi:hypothetical protein